MKRGDSMKEYLKMADIFGDIAVKVRDGNGRHVMCEDILAANCFCTDSANHIAHAINSHDELVAEVERLRDMVIRMQTYLDMAGEYPEKESGNPVRRWLFDAIDCTKQ